MTEILVKTSYTDKEITKAAQQDKVTEGWHRAIMVEMKRQISEENRHLMLVSQWRILKDPEDAGSALASPTLRNYLCLPLRNPEVPNHVPNKFFAVRTNQFFSALVPNKEDAAEGGPTKGLFVPALPHRVKGTKRYEYMGQDIEREDFEAYKEDAYKHTFEMAATIWNDDTGDAVDVLLKSVAYVLVEYEESSDFPSISRFAYDLPEGEQLVPPELIIDKRDDSDDAQDGGDVDQETREDEGQDVTEREAPPVVKGLQKHVKPSQIKKPAKRK